MTEQETVKIVTLIVMSYPATERFKDENTVKAMVAVWSNIFKDDQYKLVELAVQKHISVNKWPPNIAEIREIMADVMHPEIVPPDIAWAAVSDLMYAKGEYFYEEDIHLPPLIKRTIEIIGYSNLYRLHCEGVRGGKSGLDRVAFMDQYKPAYERMREQAILPKAVSDACSKAEKALGEQTTRMLEAVKKQREEKDEFYHRRFLDNALDYGDKKLLGGSSDESK